MKKMSLGLLLIMAHFVGANAWSAAPETKGVFAMFPVLQCPSIGQEYEQLVAKLDALKASIKKDANCDNVTLKVEEMQTKLGRDRELILGIVNKGGEGNLTEAETKAVRDYAEDLTKKVAVLQDLFLQTNHCFVEDRKDDNLRMLGSFVGEASQWVGAIAGPWGTPIALAGNVIAGFLTGMDQILKTRAGYDFSKRDQWQSYVTNLCTYHSYQEQIDHLLNPNVKTEKLESLLGSIETHLNKSAHECKECAVIQSEMASSPEASESEWLTRLAGPISVANQAFTTPLGSVTAQLVGVRNWIKNELLRIEKEGRSYWADSSGRHVLRLANNQIGAYLIDKEAPRFLQAQVQHTATSYAAFQNFARSKGPEVYLQILRIVYDQKGEVLPTLGWATGSELFETVVKAGLDWSSFAPSDALDEAKFSWLQFKAKGLELLDDAQTSTQVVKSFCSFFKHSAQYSAEIRNACTSRLFIRVDKDQTQLIENLRKASILVPKSTSNYVDPDTHPELVFSLDKIEAMSKAVNAQPL